MLTADLRYLNIAPGHRVLDLGCGEGRHTVGVNYHLPLAEVVGVDLCFNDVQTAKDKHLAFCSKPCEPLNFIYVNANGFSLPFADHSFDHIICSEVLEHIDEYQKILVEIYRLLKPAGRLCISVPRAWPEAICWKLSAAYHQVEGGHVRIFNARELKHSIQNLSFQYRGRHWAHALHAPYWWLRCLFWQEQEEDQHKLVKIYHRFLVWDMIKKPLLTKVLEKILNPIMGKSTVMYFQKTTAQDRD